MIPIILLVCFGAAQRRIRRTGVVFSARRQGNIYCEKWALWQEEDGGSVKKDRLAIHIRNLNTRFSSRKSLDGVFAQ